MVYKIKQSKKKASYNEKELKLLRKNASYPEIYREETRIALQVPEQTHKVGHAVKYKGEIYVIRKKTDKGIYVSKLKEDDKMFDVAKKEEFISDKKLQEGKAYPYYPLITWGLI